MYRVIAAVRVAALRRNTPAVRLRLGFGRVHTMYVPDKDDCPVRYNSDAQELSGAAAEDSYLT